MRRWLLFFVLLAALFYAGCRFVETRRQLSYAPCGMSIQKVLYSLEEAWGIGLPGDNETGVIAYALPEDVSRALESGGLDYLQGLRCEKGTGPRDWKGQFSGWKETPVLGDRHWVDAGGPELRTYLGQYGFDIDVRPDIEADINAAISSAESFFADGRIGVAILVPSKRRAYFVYAG